MQLLILPAALILDLIVGDPEHLPHPIRLMGRGHHLFRTPVQKVAV